MDSIETKTPLRSVDNTMAPPELKRGILTRRIPLCVKKSVSTRLFQNGKFLYILYYKNEVALMRESY